MLRVNRWASRAVLFIVVFLSVIAVVYFSWQFFNSNFQKGENAQYENEVLEPSSILEGYKGSEPATVALIEANGVLDSDPQKSIDIINEMLDKNQLNTEKTAQSYEVLIKASKKLDNQVQAKEYYDTAISLIRNGEEKESKEQYFVFVLDNALEGNRPSVYPAGQSGNQD